MAAPLVLVLYNKPLLPVDHPDAESEHTVVGIANFVAEILQKDGFRTELLGLGLVYLVLAGNDLGNFAEGSAAVGQLKDAGANGVEYLDFAVIGEH